MGSEESIGSELYSSDLIIAISVILNQDTLFLASYLYHSFQKYQICLSSQPSVICAMLSRGVPLWALSPYDSSQTSQILLLSYQGLCHSTFNYLILA